MKSEIKIEINRWKDKEWDDEMNGIKMYQAKSRVISFWRGRGERSKIKVAQNGLKHT